MKTTLTLLAASLALASVAQDAQRSRTIPMLKLTNLHSSVAQGADTTSFEGKKLPPIKMTTTTGAKVTNKKLHGKVAIIDFWATWCGPCKLTSPVMQKLYNKYHSRGLVVIGADGWEHDTPATAAKAVGYASEHHYKYTFTYGNDDLMKSLKVSGIPTMLVVDKKGVIRKVAIGFDDSLQGNLEKVIEPLLAAK